MTLELARGLHSPWIAHSVIFGQVIRISVRRANAVRLV
jgi:hypothetical protein